MSDECTLFTTSISEVVEDHGPLWAHSCFPFENANGTLLKLFHGTQCAGKQVLFNHSDQCPINYLYSFFPARFIARNYNVFVCHVKILHDLQILIITMVTHLVINDY